MALANVGATIKLTVRGTGKGDSTLEFPVPTSVWNPATGLLAALVTIRDDLVTKFNAISDGLIYRASIVVGQEEDTLEYQAGDVNIAEKADVVVNLATAGKKAVLRIPAPAVGIFLGTSGKNYNTVDPNDVALLAYTELFSTTDGSFQISDGEYIQDATPQVDSGRRNTRRAKGQI